MALTCGRCGKAVATVENVMRSGRPVCDACRDVPTPPPALSNPVREVLTTSESGYERDLRLGFRRR